jgi:hypothetical protein
MLPFDFQPRKRGTLGALAGGYAPSPDIIDRASLLPIGQYEDGSLTLAWPGFLKDAAEGAGRSFLQSAQTPMQFEDGSYAGQYQAGNLDAFNAASIAPMAGVAARGVGAIPRGALGSGGSDALTQTVKALEQPQLALRDMQILARSMGYDPQRLTTYAQRKADDLARSSWASDRTEAERLLSLVREIGSNPDALQALRRNERKSVVDAGEARRAAMTSRPVASRDGYKIVRHDDPHRSEVVYRLLDDGDRPVGKAILTGGGSDVQPYMDWVEVNSSHQRKGLGSWLYDTIGADIGKEMRPSVQLTTPEIMSFWEKRSPQKMRDWERGIYANDANASLPSLLGQDQDDNDVMSILKRYGLLGPPTGQAPPRQPVTGPGNPDPFDRYNDPFGELPEILNNPFSEPPPPPLPRLRRPLPFRLGPPTG